MSVKFKLSDLHIRKQNGTFGDLTALKGDRGLTAVQVSGTQPTDPDIDVWFKDQQSAPVMVYTTDEINDMIAPAETSPTQAAHHVGEYIICVINGQAKLYKVIDEISPQETLTVGENIQAEKIGDALIPETADLSSYFSNRVSGECSVTKCGRIAFLQFNDLKLSANSSTTISNAIPEKYRPLTQGINKIPVNVNNNDTLSVIWLRSNGTFGSAVFNSDYIIYGQIIYITAS